MNNKSVMSAVKKTAAGMASQDPNKAVKITLLKFFVDRASYFDVNASIGEIFEDFTFDRMLSCWAGRPVSVLAEESRPLPVRDRALAVAFLNRSDIDVSGENETLLGEIHTMGLTAQTRKLFGITYTPDEIREHMTDTVRRRAGVDERLVDPACGCGWFLLAFYHALMTLHYESGNPQPIKEIHSRILTENVWGVESSPEAAAIARISLSLLYRDYVECPNVICADSLTGCPGEWNGAFDWVVTNPPYVGHKKITPQLRAGVADRYREVFSGKSDLSYCFFALGRDLLRDGGMMLIITSRYFLQADSASGLRKFLLANFTFMGITDYFGFRPFIGTGVDPAIFFASKGYCPGNEFVATRPLGRDFDVLTGEGTGESNLISQDGLSPSGFALNNPDQRRIRETIEARCPDSLADLMESFQGVISGADKAFVVNSRNPENAPAIAETGVPWIKGAKVRHGLPFDGRYLLYVSGDEPEKSIPATVSRLRPYRALLERRREVRLGKRPWYALQWPRRRSLFERGKIIYPYKNDRSCFRVDREGCFFSADIYAMVAREGCGVDLDKLAMTLNSDVYDAYFKSFAKKLGGDLYEYYPNTVMRMRIPPVSVINSFETGQDAAAWLGL